MVFCSECKYCKIIAAKCPLDFEDASPVCSCMCTDIKVPKKSNWYEKDAIQYIKNRDCSNINKDNNCECFSKKNA